MLNNMLWIIGIKNIKHLHYKNNNCNKKQIKLKIMNKNIIHD